METSEVLYGAADHIAAFGHCKSRLHGEGDPQAAPACALGALKVADGLATASDPAAVWPFAHGALARYVGLSVVDWNNAPDRTAAEVIETLRAAAVIEAAKEQQVVDGLAANGVVTAAVGAVSA